MKVEIKRMLFAAFFPCVFVLLLWVIRILEWGLDADWYKMGVYPRTLDGLWGILTEPFIHADFKHLMSNSFPLIILGWCLFYFYRDLGYAVFPLIWVLSGFMTWCIGRDSWHIGASGLIYGLSFFLFFSGIIRRHIPLLAISMLVVFLYGSMVWNMLPVSQLIEENVSWEGHLSGAFSGFLCAYIFRKYGPQKPEAFPDEEEDDENTAENDGDNE